MVPILRLERLERWLGSQQIKSYLDQGACLNPWLAEIEDFFRN